MLSLKLVRSLVLGDAINTNPFLSNHHHGHNDDGDDDLIDAHRSRRKSETKTSPLLVFLPTNEIIKDTYRVCTIARDMGMNLHPNPSLSHIIFSWSTPSPSPSSLWSSTSSSTWSLSCDFVPLPFPSLAHASITHLRCFVGISRGFFKLVFCKFKKTNNVIENTNNWNCSSLSLFSRVPGGRIDSMDEFSRVLVGMGWTMFKTKNNPSLDSDNFNPTNPICVYLFRKIDSNRVEFLESSGNADTPIGNGRFRVRELRLPTLDFGNAPLRILQYILLMTENIFYLA